MSQEIINIFTVSIGLAGLCLSIFNFFHMKRRDALESAPKAEIYCRENSDGKLHLQLVFYKGEDRTIYSEIKVKDFLISSGTWKSVDNEYGNHFTCDDIWQKKLKVFIEVGSVYFVRQRPVEFFGDDSRVYFDFFIKKNKASMQDIEVLRISLKSTDTWRNLELMHKIDTRQ